MLDKLDKFLLENSGNKNKLIVVYGPTGCGKTALGIEIAKHINSKIISTDSRQIYKYLNIGTGKVTQEEMCGIKHFCLDFLNPNQNYSVGEFKNEAEKIINNLQNENIVPILVGGTGLYIDSLIFDFDIPKIPASEEIRIKYENLAKTFGKEYVYEELKKIDPEYAKDIHPNNLNYVIRAIEIKLLSGKSKKDFKKEKTLKYTTFFTTPYDNNREKLYQKINLRVEKMFEDGLIDEVKNILSNGYKKTDFGLKTIGYSEVIDFLENKISKEDCINLVKQYNRNYAKRQLTWFRNYPNNLI